MRYLQYFVGLMVLLAYPVSAQDLLNPSCQSILKDDLANLIKVDDLDGDGRMNILVGTSVNGLLYNYVYEGADCSSEWSAISSGGWQFDTEADIKSFIVADLDQDGKKEVVLNQAKSKHPGASIPSEYVTVVKDNSLVEWNFDKECGLTHSVYAADIDSSGKQNVIMGSQSGKVCALKDDTKQKEPLLWSFDSKKHPIYYVESADLDEDGSIETMALSSRYGEAFLYAISQQGDKIWEAEIEGGVYTPMLAENLVDVLQPTPGKSLIAVGTMQEGVKAYMGNGVESWSYDTGNLVSSVYTADVNDDGEPEIIVGSAPNVYALDPRGNLVWKWTAPVESTIYSISAYDVDSDSRLEIAVGTTKYIYLLNDDGNLMGSWKYAVEISGLTKISDERDADAVALALEDLDSDGEAELVAAWNWEQSTVRGNVYSTDLRVYELDLDAKKTQTTTLPEVKPTVSTTQSTLKPTMPSPPTLPDKDIPTTTMAEKEEKSGGMCCLPMLSAILAFAIALVSRAF